MNGTISAMLDLSVRVILWTSSTRPSMSSTVSLAQSGGVGSARQGLPSECAHVSAPQRSVKMMLCIDVERRFRTCAEEEPSEGEGSAPLGMPVEEYACDVVCVNGVDD